MISSLRNLISSWRLRKKREVRCLPFQCLAWRSLFFLLLLAQGAQTPSSEPSRGTCEEKTICPVEPKHRISVVPLCPHPRLRSVRPGEMHEALGNGASTPASLSRGSNARSHPQCAYRLLPTSSSPPAPSLRWGMACTALVPWCLIFQRSPQCTKPTPNLTAPTLYTTLALFVFLNFLGGKGALLVTSSF